jgi:LacI family transcriptional regulator
VLNIRTPAVPAATIVQVAERAGVSIKTVSRVLNKEVNVREDTRERVLRVARELNYRPKLSARSLAGARSFLIGMLYYDPSAAYVAGVQRGATLRCRESGYHLVVESIASVAHDMSSQLDHMLAALRPDGIILTPPICDNAEVLAAIEAAGTPCVLISPGPRSRTLPHVCMDDVRAAEELTQLLIDLGHRRIAFVKGPPEQAASAMRLRGFKRAMKARGLEVDESLLFQGDFFFQSGEQAAMDLLKRRRPPTAVFASNDDMALGVLSTAQRLGIQVPHEVSIVGFDDSPAASLAWPALTTVRQPLFDMAAAAVDMLVDRTGEPDAETIGRVLPYEVVVRASTAAPSRRTS